MSSRSGSDVGFRGARGFNTSGVGVEGLRLPKDSLGFRVLISLN